MSKHHLPSAVRRLSSVVRRPANLVLVGFMGVGKTTVSAMVARRLGWSFVDTDALVEQAVGMSVAEVFATQGEAAFRALEKDACKTVSARQHVVISVGGGAIMDPENRRLLEANGVLVLLTCERDRLIERLEVSARRGERPLLVGDIGERIDALAASRAEVYGLIPRKVDTTRLTPDEVAEQVIAACRMIDDEAVFVVRRPSSVVPTDREEP